MKAADLMVGDKVMVKVLSQIPDTYVLHTWTANDYSRDIQVKPIPLTAEILERNAYPDDGSWYCFGDFYVAHYGDCYVIHQDSDDDKREFLCRINYVHQLQHALRLCGLNELADNFKV